MLKPIATAIFVLLAASGPLVGAEPLGATSVDGRYRVVLSGDLADAPIGPFLEYDFALTDARGVRVDGAVVTIDGGMRHHGHGLPTTPQVEALGDGRYRIVGLRFSMPGAWHIVLTVRTEEGMDRAEIEFVL
ncbi:FixH family protein [Jannaschia sp. LMIT008]|uniref:FixH family protein n=1 Tax=Jannaschia maritima TaxID=3032585 RepID=UPI0028115B72|nr:FixH family protein [Jannaschia sp. LMIT008]